MADPSQIFAGVEDPFGTGFVTFQPPVIEEPRWMITGDDCQVVTVMVEPGEKIETEPGSMMFQSPNIKTDVDCDPCNGCMRRCAGEPCAKVNLVNEDENSAYVGLTPNYPAKIVPIDLKQSGNFVAKSGAIMSRIGNVEVSGNMDCNPTTCCCTSLGFCRQGLSGDGTAFIAAGGTVLTKELKDGETLIVDSESVVGYSDTVSFGVVPNQPCTCCFGGEGMCNATMTGPGTVITQSMSFKKYLKVVAPPPGAYRKRMHRGLGAMELDFD